ncbi:MAG: hypothetical protein SPE84_06510 [Bullifex sp.]|nr:hypothetical protein [Spirochaetales bacterium]MDY5056994.1 hypothetical protein [Bullifex sp.]
MRTAAAVLSFFLPPPLSFKVRHDGRIVNEYERGFDILSITSTIGKNGTQSCSI